MLTTGTGETGPIQGLYEIDLATAEATLVKELNGGRSGFTAFAVGDAEMPPPPG